MACANESFRACPQSVPHIPPVINRKQYGRPKTDSGDYSVNNRKNDDEIVKIERCRPKSEVGPYRKKFYTLDHFPRLKYHQIQVCNLMQRLKHHYSIESAVPNIDNNNTILLYLAGDISRKTERLIASSPGLSLTLSETRWPISALIYFQSEDEPFTRIEKLIKSFQPVIWEKVFIVTCKKKNVNLFKPLGEFKYKLLSRTKESVREAITLLLEKPLRECVQEFLEKLEQSRSDLNEGELSKLKSECRSVSLLLSPKKNLTQRTKTPDSIKDFLFKRRGIYGFGIWEPSEFRVFVKTDTDTTSLKSELCKLYADFFQKIRLVIVCSDMQMKRYTKQGEKLFLERRIEAKYATTGALLKNEQHSDDIYGLTCHHALPQERVHVYAKFSESSNPSKIGECVYSENKPRRDFAVFRIDENKREMCDTTFFNAMNNPCNVNIQEEQIAPDALVHKKGASTEWTTGRIESSEFYAPLVGDRSEMFLVSSTERCFSAEGDSGSVVFQHDKSPSQKSVFALGLVTGKIDGVTDESLSGALNSTLCLRLNTALSDLSEKKQLHLKFDSSSLESSSSDEVD